MIEPLYDGIAAARALKTHVKVYNLVSAVQEEETTFCYTRIVVSPNILDRMLRLITMTSGVWTLAPVFLPQ